MKSKSRILISVFLFSALFALVKCSAPDSDVYNRLMEYAGSIKVINTHEHQRNPADLGFEKYSFWVLLNKSYLNATTNTGYYQHFLAGFERCYGYKGSAFTKEGIEKLSKQIEEKYANYENWIDECFQKFNFGTMFLDQYWAPHNSNIDKKHFSFVLQTSLMVSNIGRAKQIYTETNEEVLKLKATSGIETVKTLTDYLKLAEVIIRDAKENGAVAFKNPQAYRRSIKYENISMDRATFLFAKSPQISNDGETELQDFMFHWILDKAAEYNLPVQVHTGYLAGNRNQLDNGNPVKLNDLFIRHPHTKFDLFHGGFPWTGEFVAFGKMFPNVCLHLAWLPQISKNRALVTLNEMFDCVPYNKILWGGDCHFIEETVGSLKFGKQVVCEVLASRISDGQMEGPEAKKIISAIFRENAVEIFRLERK